MATPWWLLLHVQSPLTSPSTGAEQLLPTAEVADARPPGAAFVGDLQSTGRPIDREVTRELLAFEGVTEEEERALVVLLRRQDEA